MIPKLSTSALSSGWVLSITLVASLAVGSVAQAAPILISQTAALSDGSVSFSFGGSAATYTLSSSGDIFNPVAVQTAGTAQVNTFGGFLGIPLQPTTNFIDRGTVTFGSSNPYGAFPVATTIPYSNGGNFLGLSFALADGTHYGFVEFVDETLVGYGYESTPGATITAVDIPPAPVPEPGALALLAAALAGFGFVRYWSRSLKGAAPTLA